MKTFVLKVPRYILNQSQELGLFVDLLRSHLEVFGEVSKILDILFVCKIH